MRKIRHISVCLAGVFVALSGLTTAKADMLTNAYSAFTGPASAGLQYSDLYGAILQAQLTQGITPKQATSLEVEAGLNNRRANLGWGYALTPQQRIKLSAEHLAQFMQFSFNSGDASRWISQNAIGAGYQYLIPGSFINDVNADVSYSKSISDNMPSRSIASGLNLRHAAGANYVGGSLGVDITPTYGTLIGLQTHYDDVNYEVRYEGDDDNSGLGVTATWQQLITKHFKLNLLASERVPYQNYQGGLSWLMNTHEADQMELGFDVERIIGKHRFNYDDTRLGINFTYLWKARPEQIQNGYSLVSNDTTTDVSRWIAQPAVYLKQVLARRDQR